MNLTTLAPKWQPATNVTVTNGLEQNLPAAIIIGIVAVILAFENYLLLFAVSEKRLKRVPEILIFWLALSSLLNSFTTVAVIAYHRFADNEGRRGVDTLCKIQYWFATTLRTNDICTTTLMSLDRYFAVTKPFLYRCRIRRHHGWVSIAVSFSVSSIISCLPFLGFGSISRVVPSLCVIKWDSGVSILILSLAFVQFAIVLWCYVAIFLSIKQLVRRQKAMAKSQEITYDSPSLSRRDAPSPTISLSPSVATSSMSLDLQAQGNQSEKAIPLRIKAVANRTVSNYEGAQSESFGLAKQQEGVCNMGSMASLCTLSVNSHILPRNGMFRPLSSKSENKASIKNDKNIPLRRVNSLREGNQALEYSNSLKPSIYRHLDSIRGRLHNSIMRRKRETSEKRQWRESEHFAKVMGVIVLLFYISWIPLATSITLTLILGMTSLVLNITYVSLLMTLGGPLLIPIVYGVMAQAYRSGYRRAMHYLFCCSCGTSISSAFKRKQEVTSQLPYYITGQKQQSPRIPLEPRGVNSRKQCTEMSVTCEKSCQRDCVTFESNAAKYSGNAEKYSGNVAKYSGNAATHSGNAAADDSSDDDIAKQRVIVAIEMQTGFDGDTEDSDNCASESQPANRPLHLEMNESLSVPVGTRIKRRRLKRRAQSEEIISNLKEVKLVNKSKYLDVPKRLIDWDCRAEIDADTDSTDLEQDAASVFNGNITIQIVPVRKDAKQQIHCESA